MNLRIMKLNSTLLLCLFFNLGFAQFKYINPTPGSMYHNPETNIILKNGSLIDAGAINNNLITIYGSKSGKHEWSARLSDDNKTIVVKPEVLFEFGETVTVAVSDGLRKTTGEEIQGTSFSFQIRNEVTPAQK